MTTSRLARLVRAFLLPSVALAASVAMACAAITKNGTQCKRAPAEGSRYCWQHGGKATTSASASASKKVSTPKSYEVYQRRKTQGARLFSKEARQRKFKEQGGFCPHCGKQYSFEEMEGDHIVPYSKGGATVYSNLQMLCRPCNRSKGNRYSH